MHYSRVLVLGDVHGCRKMLVNLIEKVIRFNPAEDKLIQLGDVIDRGPDSMACILYLDDLRKKYPESVVLLLGNHEQKAYESLKCTKDVGTMSDMRDPLEWILSWGGSETLRSFGGVENAIKLLLPYIESLDVYHLYHNYIFVHGGVPRGTKDIRNVPIKDLLHNRDLDWDGDGIVVCGHTVHHEVANYGKVICVDTGACFFGKLSAFDVVNRRVYWIEDEVPKAVSAKI